MMTTTRLTAIFQDNPGKPVPECVHSGLIWGGGAKDEGGGGDNWSYKTCNAPVKSSPPTYVAMPSIFTGRMPFLSPNQQGQSTERRL